MGRLECGCNRWWSLVEVGSRGPVVVARLLESTKAADQSLPYLVSCSHHVILGFDGWYSDSGSVDSN